MAGPGRLARPFLIGLAVLVLSVSAWWSASADPYHPYGGNPDVSTPSVVDVETSNGRELAQSFEVLRPLWLKRVSLFVNDTPANDTLWVGIVADSVGLPDGFVLAQSLNDSAAVFGWVNFDFNVPVNLSPGTMYWIVANSSALPNQGYRWWNSGYDANATGTAVSRSGTNWVTLPGDFAFLVFGYELTVTLANTPALASVQAEKPIDFLITVEVVGNEPALNMTIDYEYPEALIFQRHTASAAGLCPNENVTSARLRCFVPQVVPGTYEFRVTFIVNPSQGTGPVNTTAYLDYEDLLGLRGRVVRIASVQITSDNPFENPAVVAILAAGAAFGAAVSVERAFGRFRIEEAFLVRRDGMLVVHRTRNPTLASEADQFAGMFTAIQDFVRDSFRYNPGRQLQQLSFGNLNGYIAPGKIVFLAVIFRGRIGIVARRALVRILRSFEAKRGESLQAWDGEQAQLQDLEKAFESVLRARTGIILPFSVARSLRSPRAKGPSRGAGGESADDHGQEN